MQLITPGILPRGERAKTRRGTYFIQTWGCQMNEEDSEQMALHLRDLGFEPTDFMLEAQVVLLNTCSVRKKPEDKAFSLLGELAALKLARPETVVGVCGCMAQARAKEIHRRAPHVDFVLGTGDLGLLPGLVEEAIQRRKFQARVELPERKGAIVTDVPQRHLGRPQKLKAFVPIQYGCDKFCSFCIVPTTRGRERSRPTDDIVEEVTTLASQGTREVTLLGQTVNSYGKNLAEGRVPFGKLLWRLAEIPGIERLRYMSPYPRDFTADLIETIRDCPQVMEQVHLPLQSGDEAMLKDMKRHYDIESFLGIVDQLRAQVPGIALTTDIIVGFPGETDEQFENTLSVMRKVRFDGAYMFAYSIRPGTIAGDREDQIAPEMKKARLAQLIDLQNEITCDINAQLVGQEFEVLVEGASVKTAGSVQGYTREFRMMHFQGDPSLAGQLVRVRATSSHQWGLGGELV